MKTRNFKIHALLVTCVLPWLCPAADTTPPTIMSVGSVDGATIAVCFSESLDATTASDSANYLINGIGASSASLRSDGASVLVRLSSAVSGPFSVTVNGVRDVSGNVIAANSIGDGTALGFASTDVDSPSPPSDVSTCDGNTVIVTAGGNDIWGNRDQFNFIHKAVEGDFDARVRVTRLDYIGNNWSKAGLMVRETLASRSRHHMVNVNPQTGANQYEVLFRDFEGGLSASWGGSFGVSYPDGWMRLQRQGDTLTAYRSSDGSTWEQIGQTTPAVPYPPIVFLGLATCAAQGNGVLGSTTAEYDSFSMTASPPSHPFVTSASPQGSGARADSPVRITLQDGLTQVNPDSIALSVDGAPVTPTVSKNGNVTTILYESPTVFAAGSTHTVQLGYSDTATPSVPGSFSFAFTVAHYVGPNGNLYEIVVAPAIPWEDAKLAAEQRTYIGRAGHLATITGPEEDVFIQQLIQEAGLGGAGGEIWAGAFQLPDQPNRTDGWMWVNNEGPVPGFNFGSTYANWFFDEPNDCCVTTFVEDNEENYLGLGFFGTLGWNDDGPTHLNNIGGYVVEYDRLIVPLDIKPGSFPNSINLDAQGKLAVAVLSTDAFNAAVIDPSTVRFGRTGSETTSLKHSMEDVNKDGLSDFVCHFEVQDTALMCGDTSATLTAYTTDGVPLKGSDSVNIVRCPPYALSVQALQDVNKVTDLYFNVSVVLAGHNAPTLAQGLQLKSFDVFSKLRWTKNLHDLALATGANGSALHLQYSDMEHGQNVKAKMDVKDSTGRMQVLHHEARVRFRPDLAVTGVVVPAQVNARQIINIPASIRELKGDLGATANVYLLDGGAVIDSATVTVDPLGEIAVVFSTRFSESGVHQLKVVVGDVAPGDYDLANNEHSFTIDVVLPSLQPVFYCLNYSRSEGEYYAVADNPFWISTYREQFTSEFLGKNFTIPFVLQSPVARVAARISADGVQRENFEAFDLPLFVYYEDGCFTFSSGATLLADNVFLYIDTYKDCFGAEQTFVNLQKYANTYVFFSSFHDKVWGTISENSGGSAWGTPLNAMNSIQTRLTIDSSEGTFGGEGVVNSLFSSPFNNEWDFFDFETHYTGFNRGIHVFGGNCDMTTP